MRIVQFNGKNYGRIMDFTEGKAYVSANPDPRLLLRTLDGPIEIKNGDFVIQKAKDTYCLATLKELIDENY